MNAHTTQRFDQGKTDSATWYEYHFSNRQGDGLPQGIYKARNAQWNVVVHRSKGRYVEDASSLGGSMFDEYEFRLTVRAATAAEIDDVERKHREEKESLVEARTRQRVFQDIDGAFRKFGEWPKTPLIAAAAPRFQGRFLMNVNDKLMYVSSGTTYVVDEEGNALWSLSENGLDGDDWSRNNLNGTIALRLPLARAEAVKTFLRNSSKSLLDATPSDLVEHIEEWASKPCENAVFLTSQNEFAAGHATGTGRQS